MMVLPWGHMLYSRNDCFRNESTTVQQVMLMSCVQIIHGDSVNEEYVLQALALDYLVYPDEFHLDRETCLAYFHKNPHIYFIAITDVDNTVVGYINFSPLDCVCYNALKRGEAIDTIVTADSVLKYEPHQHYLGYFSSIVVHPDYRHRGIARKLLDELFEFLYLQTYNHDIWFDEITADIITPEGARLASKFGFCPVTRSSHNSATMVLNPHCPGTGFQQEQLRFFRLYKTVGANGYVQI